LITPETSFDPAGLISLACGNKHTLAHAHTKCTSAAILALDSFLLRAKMTGSNGCTLLCR